MDYFTAIKKISAEKYISEPAALKELEPFISALRPLENQITSRARNYLGALSKVRSNLTQSMLTQYPLKTAQGYAIMSLAECLGRIPDRETAYALIDDKIRGMKWNRENAKSSVVMNAVAQTLNLASHMGGNAVTYTALSTAFKTLGKEYIIGSDIDAAIRNAKVLKKDGYLLSYDMLGEGARTDLQADVYSEAYKQAAGKAKNKEAQIFQNDGISIKLSALHPRYELLKIEQLRLELLPRIKAIINIAKQRNIAVTIDAEEAARLDLSLLLFSELYLDESCRYKGLGLAVQAYHKVALHVLEFLRDLAQIGGMPIPVRLVKGAYWDYEIKKAQADGLPDYPVYTKKAHSDLSYLACAKFMLDNNQNFYPQFATHNLMSICAIIEMAQNRTYEFQKLYGMGDEIYNTISDLPAKCRVYAPVGEQKDLLAYLIRRLLENGANSSFVNQLAHAKESREIILNLPFNELDNPQISLKPPAEIYKERRNSNGIDLGSLAQIGDLAANIDFNSAVTIGDSSEYDCIQAIADARLAFPAWNSRSIEDRAGLLEKTANAMESNVYRLAGLLVTEAKRNIADALSEIREVVDFCRYYAGQARQIFPPRKMQSITGEDNFYQLEGRGIFVCISPWNFPLSIFVGQVAAALVSGNCVIAKPAEQTPRIAAMAISIMHEIGIPMDVLHLVIGEGSVVGGALVANPDIAGVCFTGSTETARIINKSIAANNPKIIPFIAETGGQNCMIVDSTALIERVVDDMVISAFGSAGQRCSALRVAYVQEEIADQLIHMLAGAMAEIEVSATTNFSSDVGEVIDAEAQHNLLAHIELMKSEAKFVYATQVRGQGNYVAPHLFEISSLKQLPREVFGPVLHIIRYSDLDKAIEEINSSGYGLTFGVQTRIGHRINYLAGKIHAGNIYANRSMIGAVVESQPFGGHGLSGTGPKAGGPEYLKRFCLEKVVTINKTAIGGNLDLL